MYFKKLEIIGFKSFAEKTTLHFEPGITAIVGPNGCGKSNIFDSIRWCLGEQSIKSLRGGKMEDVIFNGTETAAPQGLCEVSLSISNEAKILPIDYEEVSITRRLFRSGESDYLINNNSVRLKDINELLMGTGIGAESYSLIEQGKIDLVISSKPEDRRLVFDEATGVSKYKAKKKEAARKLEETDNNLLRVNDIVVEVKRQIGSIERQANKARRYQEVFGLLKSAELKYCGFELKSIKSQKACLEEESRKSRQDEAESNAQLQAMDARLISQQKELQEQDRKLVEIKEQISNLENTNGRDSQHIKLNQDRIFDLTKHARLLGSQKETLAQKIALQEKNITELTAQAVGLRQDCGEKEAALNLKQGELDALSVEAEETQNEIKKIKEKIFELNVGQARANNQTNENAANLQSLASRLKRLELEKVKTFTENSDLLKNIENLNGEISCARTKLDRDSQQLEALTAQKEGLEKVLKEEEESLRKLENDKLSLRSQMEFLKELKLTYDNIAQARNGVIEIEALPQEKISGIIAHAGNITFEEARKLYRISCELKFISFEPADFEIEIEKIAKNIEGLIGRMSEKERLLMTVLKGIQTVQDELQNEKMVLANKETVSSNLGENARKIQEELSLVETELKEVNSETRAALEAEERLKNEAGRLESENAGAQQRLFDTQNTVARNTAKREDALVELTRLKAEVANQKIKKEDIEASLNFFKTALTEDIGSAGLAEQEIASSLRKVEELNEEISGLQGQIRSNDEEIELNSVELNRLSQIKTEELNSLDFIQKQIIDQEEKLDKCKEENHRYQMQEQELNFKYSNIKTRVLQTYEVDLDQAAAGESEAGPVDLGQLTSEIAVLKEKVESFGTVNLVALEELEELKSRHDFLTQQQNDLFCAKESLNQAIQKINRTTRKMFLETFQVVAEEFKNYFKLLFGGGEAKLYLLDEEDVLESGIEIICRPPGKKLQNISLLSGGEKTLSAIALIFAIFKTKPSPFCVLDEIDAALDESNIDRFSRMLADFSKISQFIVITHNKKTIARANCMYGITMEQSGISKIVSVKLHERRPSEPAQTTEQEQPLSAPSPEGQPA